MASITASGLASGLDVNSIVTQLMTIERQPLVTMQKEETAINAKISSFGKIESALSTLRTKSAAFTSSSMWGKTSTTLSDPTIATATPILGKNGASGSYSLQVDALAAAQSTSSRAFSASTDTLSEGSLTIELGRWTGGAPATGFTPKSGSSAVTISIGAGETSLDKIRDKINAANAGVTAGLVTDASGVRLTLRSASTGEENAFRVQASESSDDGVDGTGLSALAYDAAGTSSMTRNQAARNAQAVINGLTVTSASNTLDTVVEGVSIKLNKTTTSAIDMTVASDPGDVKTALQEFVTAYNSLNDLIRSESKYDAATKTGGKLQGDRTVWDIQGKIRSQVIQPFTGAGSGSLGTLSDIGISVTSTGGLEVKASKLDAALATNPAQVKALLSGGDESSIGSTGLMTRFRKIADQIQGADGALESRTTGLRSQLKRNSDRQGAFELRMTTVEARMRAQYGSLDQRMSGINSMSNAVSLMIQSMYSN